jgi:glycosyltransferase involved in cell wall biosynthesis
MSASYAKPTKFSVVTISYNQAEFLEGAIQSVLAQAGPEVEYIVVDPGSTDGSRDIIEKYRSQISHVVYDKDLGPADGLNKGFARATGDIFCYLNSDDLFEPGAFAIAAQAFEGMPGADVICGHAFIVDELGQHIRKVWSDPHDRYSVAYGAAIQIQPSTFIKRTAFERSGGFRIENRSNWDGELLVDLVQTGSKIEIIDEFLSCYRLHQTSITNSGSHDEKINKWVEHRFTRLMGRGYNMLDPIIMVYFKILRQVKNPSAFIERLLRGAVYRRGV